MNEPRKKTMAKKTGNQGRMGSRNKKIVDRIGGNQKKGEVWSGGR